MSAVYPDIPRFAPPHTDPAKVNTVQYWGFFSREEITREAGQLLMLDIDFGRECSLRCPTCFRRRNAVDDSAEPDLTYDALLDVLRQASELGLKTVKICGAGEPFENPELLRLARTLTAWDVGLSIFTKGHVLGDDELASRVFAHEDVRDARSLAERFHDLKTSVLVGFQSFRCEIQDQLVGNVPGHTVRRNRAVQLLVNVGFNRSSPTRVAFCANPITRANYEELFDIYVYCRERNILPVIAALMVSGKQFNRRFLERVDVSDEHKLRLWTLIYQYNIKHGIQTPRQIQENGISALPGIHPCNQIAAGLYVTCNGNVLRCPGDASRVLANVRQASMRSVWRDSASVRTVGFDCRCPPKDGKTLPHDLYGRVLDRLSIAARLNRSLCRLSSQDSDSCEKGPTRLSSGGL